MIEAHEFVGCPNDECEAENTAVFKVYSENGILRWLDAEILCHECGSTFTAVAEIKIEVEVY